MVSQMEDVFKVETIEYGFAYETAAPSSQFKMVIPKLHGNLSGTGTDSVSGSGVFDNEVKPSYAKKVSRQGWIPVRFTHVPCDCTGDVVCEDCGHCGHNCEHVHPNKPHGCDGLYLWKTKMVGGVILKGTRFPVHFVNGDLTDPFITDY